MSQFVNELAARISDRLGNKNLTVHPQMIGNDDTTGFFYYIPRKSLLEFHPLLLVDYHAMPGYTHPLILIMSHKDWGMLEQNAMSVEEYIENSSWNFGYFWGGGNMFTGIYWKPFDEKGIHDIVTIQRYMTILQCRTALRSSGYMATKEQCSQCIVENCPFNQSHTGVADWENEVQETDERLDFLNAVCNMLTKRYGLNVRSCYSSSETGENSIFVYPDAKKNTVSINLPSNILVDLLYHPGKYDFEELINNIPIKAGIPWYTDINRVTIPAQHIDVPKNATLEFFHEYWKNTHFASEWFITEEVNNDVPSESSSEMITDTCELATEHSSEAVVDALTVHAESRFKRMIRQIIQYFKG